MEKSQPYRCAYGKLYPDYTKAFLILEDVYIKKVPLSLSWSGILTNTAPDVDKEPIKKLWKNSSKADFLVRVAGLEPARYRYRGILSPLCLPIPPHPHKLPAGTFQHVPQLKTRTFTCTALMSLSHILGTLVGEGGFEPPKLLAADLQSVPFGHSGIRPIFALISSDYNTTDMGKNQEVY